MERFLFVLGSNWQLSIAELDNYLKYSKHKGKILDYSANIAVCEFESLHKDRYYVNELMDVQFTLGGCQKIAKIFDFIDIRTIKQAFPSQMDRFKEVEKNRKQILHIIDKSLAGKNLIFPKIYESMFFAISIYPNLYDDEYYSEILTKHFLPFLNKEIKECLLQKGAEKALYYKYPEKNIKSGNLNPIFPHNVIKYNLLTENRAEIIFGFTEEGVYIARTFTVDDPSFKRKIDEERPFREFKSSISPKLATILLNFLNLFDSREKKKVLDPFVGNGTIVLIGLLQDFQIYGSDIDERKVKNTIRNMNWLMGVLEEEIPMFFDKRIVKVDIKELSKYFNQNFFDGICTEPELGPFFLEKPYYIQAKELLEKTLEPLYNDIFREAFIVLKNGSRICTIAPIIDTIDGNDVQLDIEKIAAKYYFKQVSLIDPDRFIDKTNLKLQFRKNISKSLIDAKKGQIIKRKLFVFEKMRKNEL
ncbi:MAG: TRM11 family SAM-dependent methyltransferase [Promethearchaeota archaeon]|jgi:tRNA G10  N-methylase Trm11